MKKRQQAKRRCRGRWLCCSFICQYFSPFR